MLTQLIDPRGQSLQLTWDSQTRLVAITDAIGEVTTLAYEVTEDPLKVTKITDPFGRFATFTYNNAGQLTAITDVIGLTSRFAYGPDDFVTSLTTPYGTTTFRHEPNAANTLNVRFIEATDPLGGTEHLEFQWETPTLAASVPSSDVPTGFAAWNWNLDHYNTFYWSKRAWAAAANDLTKAEITHWLVKPEWQGWQKYSYVPHSIKQPLEGRVWYAYPGQTVGNEDELGWWRLPSRTGRVLDDGTSQIYETTYNTQGSVLTKIDPLGRQTTYSYGTNGVDLVDVRQTTGGMNDLLQTNANYTALHQPQSVTDGAGETTTLSYNSLGKVLTVTNAKSEANTFTYDVDGRPMSLTEAITGAASTYTYDSYGRVRTVTDSDGYTVTTDYDAFDRAVRVSYPDGTYEETTYDRLDVSTRRDRAGRVTRYYYDALRQLVATRDPAGRVERQEWCTCGTLDALVDANNHRTRWDRDLQGRVTQEMRADGFTATSFTYGTATGRLLTTTDPKGQLTTYVYALDDALLSSTYTNVQIATPSVNYTYDTAYPRLTTMTDGSGTTSYAYHPVGQLGAGQIATVDGPLTNDTITYAYDQLGRVVTRAINNVGVTWSFDALGRVTSEANALGNFTYTYDGVTSRLSTVTYPNAQTSTYTYFPNTNDRRLQTIHHKYSNGSTLAKFDYTYDIVGNIATWRQQADTTAVLWDYVYDAADQVIAAVKNTTDLVPSVLARYAYAYDPAGNRTVEQIDDDVTGATYDVLNRLVSQQPSGPMQLAGTVSEPATVKIQGVPARVGTDNTFAASVPLSPGTNTVTISAADSTNNQTSKQYEIDSFGSALSFTYDANGNLTSDGTRTFEWDARNQLLAVNAGTHRSEFTYDGLQRRVRAIEKEDGVIQQDKRVLWCETAICEERGSDGATVTRRAFSHGEQIDGIARFVATDHLESVREVTDASSTLLARYTFDPWGRRTIAAGNGLTASGFTGHQWEGVGSEWLAQYRVYDPELGRWISEDPAGRSDGSNLYAYALGNPIRFFDPDGLSVLTCCGMTSALPAQAVMIGLECMSKCLQTPILISSGWRTKQQNDDAPGHAKKSQHLLGLAADVHIPPSMTQIRAAAAECGFYVLAKKYPNRVHIDAREGRKPKTNPNECTCEKIRRLP